MIYGKYHFFCILENDAILPPYKGSTFRGLFGLALKKVVCALKFKECPECLLRETCIYPFVFETHLVKTKFKENKRIVFPPHPYIIEPVDETRTNYYAGELFDFSLILLGRANEYLPYFIYAIECMGKTGIGKRIHGERGQFILQKVVAEDGQIIFSHDDQTIQKGDFFHELSIEETSYFTRNIKSSLKIELETPLRIKFQNRLEASLPFHILVRAMLRRVSSLYNCYGNGEPPFDYRGLIKRAESVTVLESDLQWYDWKRYSNRQDQSMFMGGIIGKIRYEGELSEYLPLIKSSEKLHIGKQTTFGLGKVKVLETDE